MDDEITHIITVTVTGRYMHGKEQEHAQVRIGGNGDLDHFIETFRSALVASGFGDMAENLRMLGIE